MYGNAHAIEMKGRLQCMLHAWKTKLVEAM